MMQKYFQILGDANRLRVINFIGNNKRTVSEIVEETGLSQPLVSHHLKVLRDNQILETLRDGPFVYHILKNPKLLDVLGLFWELLPRETIESTDNVVFQCPPIWKRMLENMLNFTE
ncbi:transcriptional regulator, ArsR family [Pseudobacteroides cellulosolvens ATCC 35603 = DSM 2933]|uniref:Transcriptional regulator, ArsR family n=2 Tax=Pseudobacteroides cellulosolvens TaxID=35825 RepID=A0A0L6JWR7_9FIRM|nr:transcriptional regulator, ArsR family [Pseudobacteroides cellulosolvens ATCC 35603 = DSM 2933]